MASGYGYLIDDNATKWLTYWIAEYARGNIRIHVDRNNGRFARTSQEAYDNMLTLYKILSDENTGCYKAYGGTAGVAYAQDVVCGTPAMIRDFIIKSKMRPAQGHAGLIDNCGSDIHGTTVICGQGGIDINKLKAKTCLMTAIAGLMGVIEVVSGYNPFFHTQDYVDMQGYYSYNGDKYYSMDPTTTYTYSKTDRYGVGNYSLANKVWTPYTYCNYWTNGVNNVNMGTEAQMRNCKYGIIGLLMPYSCSCYAYGRKYNPQNNPNSVMLTDGDEINFIEQILYDICGLPVKDMVWTKSNTGFSNYLPWGLSNGNITYARTDYVKFNGQSSWLYDYNQRIFNNTFERDWNHWNGWYTRREFANVVCNPGELEVYDPDYDFFTTWNPFRNANGGFVASVGVDPPWTSHIRDLGDYQYLPWWASSIRNQPETATVQLINSIDTWDTGYWTPEKIQQAKEASRYWYDEFGGPRDTEGIKFQGKTNYNYVIMNV